MNPLVWHPSGEVLPQSTIRVYQIAMSLRGFGPRTIASFDGVLGPTTMAAIRAYQAASNLRVTGQFDQDTIRALAAEVASLEASGQRVYAAAEEAARLNAGARPATRPAVTGSHPTVAAIQTAATPSAPAQVVAVPPQVSQMLPPSTVAQLQTMPAPAVQSFVNDLVRKVATAENTVTSEGTGKDFTAVPMVAPDGTVVAAVQQVNTTLAPKGWWAGLTPNERIGYGVGGAVVGVAVLGGIVYLFSRK